MGFAMRIEQGHARPEIVCDTCGKPIDDLLLALVTYDWSKDSLVMAHIYHKGGCDPGGSGRDRPPETVYWNELRHFLPWLLWNKGWGEKKTDAADEDSLGEIVIRVPRPADI